MNLSTALKILKGTVKGNERHADYKRVTELAEEYFMLATGEGQGKLIKEMYPSENEQEQQQRQELTRSVTPAIVRIFSNNFSRIKRIDPAVFELKVESDPKKEAAKKIMDAANNWNGEGKTLLKWLLSDVHFQNTTDPNRCYALEVKSYNPNEDAMPLFSYIASSSQVLNFKKWGDSFEWALISDTAYQNPFGELVKEPKYVLYTDTQAIILEKLKRYRKDGKGKDVETDEYKMAKSAAQPLDFEVDYQISGNPNSEPVYHFVTLKNKGNDKDDAIYRMYIHQHDIGFAPVFSVGYIKDELTRGRTYVNYFDKVKGLLYDIVDLWSEKSVTHKLYVHPIITVYIPECPTNSEGKTVDCRDQSCNQKHCESCHTQSSIKSYNFGSQRVRVFTFDPDNSAAIADIDITKTIHFSNIPSEVIDKLNEGFDNLFKLAYVALFGTENYAQNDNDYTATAALVKQQVLFDALFSLTEKCFGLCKLKLKAIAAYNDIPAKTVSVTITPSESLLPQSVEDLIALSKAANDADVGIEVRDRINSKLRNKVFEDDVSEAKALETWQRHIPLLGKSKEERMQSAAMAGINDYSSTPFDVFLFSFYPVIRTQIEDAYANTDSSFYGLSFEQQRKVVLDTALAVKRFATDANTKMIEISGVVEDEPIESEI